MSQVYVFHPKNVIERIEAGLPTVHVEVNKDSKGAVSDEWMTLKIEAVPIGGKTVVKGPAYFRIGRTDEAITVTKSLANLSDKTDYRVKKNYVGGPGGLKLDTKVAKSGLFGKMIDLLVPIRDAQIKKLVETGVVKPAVPALNETIKTKFSDAKDVPEELRGKPRTDKPYRITFDVEKKFSDRHPAEPLRGKQMSTFKGTVIKNGAPAIDVLGVTKDNAHTFLKAGVRLVNARLLMDGISMSKQGISNKILLNECEVLEPEPSTFSDEIEEPAVPIVINTDNAPAVAAPVQAPVVMGDEVPEENPPAPVDAPNPPVLNGGFNF
ncbi:hypothetical protein F-E9_361 [Faustovirus]|nr:hypothetical protein F-E9_361 [Faustovirus]